MFHMQEVADLYNQRQLLVDRIISGNIIPWKGTFPGLLQIQAILCTDMGKSECNLQRISYLPKKHFAEITIKHFMEALTTKPFDMDGANILVASLLWSGIYSTRFDPNGFLCLVNSDVDIGDEVTPGQLLIPQQEELHQFDVTITPIRAGILHSYANALQDLLNQPCFEVWDERVALVLRMSS